MTRIIFTPWQEADGQWRSHDEVVEMPASVELEGAWVHVVTYGAAGIRTLIRSYPAHTVDGVIWKAES